MAATLLGPAMDAVACNKVGPLLGSPTNAYVPCERVRGTMFRGELNVDKALLLARVAVAAH